MGVISIEKNKLFHVGLVSPLSRPWSDAEERFASGWFCLSSAKRDESVVPSSIRGHDDSFL